jgi:hypothetical protein
VKIQFRSKTNGLLGKISTDESVLDDNGGEVTGVISEAKESKCDLKG